MDPLPELVADASSLSWNFGSVAKGTLIKHPLAIANVGFGPLYTYLPATVGLALDQSGADTIGAADMSSYVLTLRTGDLPQGAYDKTITIRTSDKLQPTLSLHVLGTITAPSADTDGGLVRPLDVPVTVQGPKNAGEWVEFDHSLGPDPATLHPVKVYDPSYTTLHGVGKYVTAFGAGTSSTDMFGDGRDGDLLVESGQTVTINDIRTGVITTAFKDSNEIPVQDVASFNIGDKIMIHQSRSHPPSGEGVGNWEIHSVIGFNPNSYASTPSILISENLNNDYLDGGSWQAQVIRVPQFHNVTINNGGLLQAPAWNGGTGGDPCGDV